MKSFLYCLPTFLLFSSYSALARNYEVTQVVPTSYSQSIKRSGKVDFKRVLRLSFKSTGYLNLLSVDEGDFFEKSQLLAALDTVELKEVKNARYAELLQAKRNVKRLTVLIEQNLSSEIELDQAQTQLETVRATYKVAYYNLEKAQVIAPFNGVVLARFSELGELQSPNNAALEVAASDNNLVVKLGLTDDEIAFVNVGQPVVITLANLGKVDGRISKVPVKSNSTNQLYVVEVLLEKVIAGQGVVAGQLAQVELNLESDKLVYQVPNNALVKMADNGDGIFFTQKNKNSTLQQQAFHVLSIDSQYIYLSAESDNSAVSFVTSGWQQYALTGQ